MMGEAAPKDSSMEDILASIRRIIGNNDESDGTSTARQNSDGTPVETSAGSKTSASSASPTPSADPQTADPQIPAQPKRPSPVAREDGELAEIAAAMRETLAEAKTEPAAAENAQAPKPEMPGAEKLEMSPASATAAASAFPDERKAQPSVRENPPRDVAETDKGAGQGFATSSAKPGSLAELVERTRNTAEQPPKTAASDASAQQGDVGEDKSEVDAPTGKTSQSDYKSPDALSAASPQTGLTLAELAEEVRNKRAKETGSFHPLKKAASDAADLALSMDEPATAKAATAPSNPISPPVASQTAQTGETSSGDSLAEIAEIVQREEETSPQIAADSAEKATQSTAHENTRKTAEIDTAEQKEGAEGAVAATGALAALATVAGTQVKEAMAAKESEAEGAETEAFREALVSPSTTTRVAASMARLEDIASDKQARQAEAIMRPMIKAWLDENLPAIVERAVEGEIARIVGKHGHTTAASDGEKAKSKPSQP